MHILVVLCAASLPWHNFLRHCCVWLPPWECCGCSLLAASSCLLTARCSKQNLLCSTWLFPSFLFHFQASLLSISFPFLCFSFHWCCCLGTAECPKTVSIFAYKCVWVCVCVRVGYTTYTTLHIIHSCWTSTWKLTYVMCTYRTHTLTHMQAEDFVKENRDILAGDACCSCCDDSVLR